MAAITWADVTAVAGELANFATAGQTALLSVVNSASMIDVSAFDGEDGPLTKVARSYLAAHLAASSRNGTGGALISESAGGLSRSFAAPSTRSQYFTTSYGQMYLMLASPACHGPALL